MRVFDSLIGMCLTFKCNNVVLNVIFGGRRTALLTRSGVGWGGQVSCLFSGLACFSISAAVPSSVSKPRFHCALHYVKTQRCFRLSPFPCR